MIFEDYNGPYDKTYPMRTANPIQVYNYSTPITGTYVTAKQIITEIYNELEKRTVTGGARRLRRTRRHKKHRAHTKKQQQQRRYKSSI